MELEQLKLIRGNQLHSISSTGCQSQCSSCRSSCLLDNLELLTLVMKPIDQADFLSRRNWWRVAAQFHRRRRLGFAGAQLVVQGRRRSRRLRQSIVHMEACRGQARNACCLWAIAQVAQELTRRRKPSARREVPAFWALETSTWLLTQMSGQRQRKSLRCLSKPKLKWIKISSTRWEPNQDQTAHWPQHSSWVRETPTLLVWPNCLTGIPYISLQTNPDHNYEANLLYLLYQEESQDHYKNKLGFFKERWINWTWCL